MLSTADVPAPSRKRSQKRLVAWGVQHVYKVIRCKDGCYCACVGYSIEEFTAYVRQVWASAGKGKEATVSAEGKIKAWLKGKAEKVAEKLTKLGWEVLKVGVDIHAHEGMTAGGCIPQVIFAQKMAAPVVIKPVVVVQSLPIRVEIPTMIYPMLPAPVVAGLLPAPKVALVVVSREEITLGKAA